MGKEEIAPNEQFLLFPQCFLNNQKLVSTFVRIFDIVSFFAAELEEPKIGISSNGLNDKIFLKPLSTLSSGTGAGLQGQLFICGTFSFLTRLNIHWFWAGAHTVR